jgi:hypothetical protein
MYLIYSEAGTSQDILSQEDQKDVHLELGTCWTRWNAPLQITRALGKVVNSTFRPSAPLAKVNLEKSQFSHLDCSNKNKYFLIIGWGTHPVLKQDRFCF